jgi:hypothetical protein
LSTFPVAELDIYDVKAAVLFLTSEPGGELYATLQACAARAGLAGDIVAVWQNPSGRIGFIGPVQQLPFFESLSYEQLFAQVNRTITCE